MHVWIVVYLLLAFGHTCGADSEITEGEVLRQIFNNYDRLIKPNAYKPDALPFPVSVSALLKVRELRETNLDGKFDASLSMTQFWSDERLNYAKNLFENKTDFQVPAYITVTDGASKLWLPDTFFRVGFSEGQVEQQTYKIYRNGTVVWSQKMTTVLACPMDVYQFPFDDHTCTFTMSSFAHEEYDIAYTWHESKLTAQVRINDMLQHFALDRVKAEETCIHRARDGRYSCILGHLYIYRLSNGYMIMCIVPIHVTVVLSWIMFLMPARDYHSKFMIGFSCLFFMAIVWVAVNAGGHVPAEVTALHVHAFSCFFFIVLVLLIQVVSLAIAKRAPRSFHRTPQGPHTNKDKKRGNQPDKRLLTPDEAKRHRHDEDKDSEASYSIRNKHAKPFSRSSIPVQIDIICLIVVPVIFVMFTFIYALIYHGL